MGATQSFDESFARIPRRERPLKSCEVYDREQHDAQWLPPPQSKDRVYLLISLADAALAAKEGAVPKDVKCEFCCSADTAVVEGSSDPGDLSDASLLLSTQWSDTDKALLRARAMQRLGSELSHLCREGDACTHAVAQCTHTLHSIHAAMTRAAAASKRSSTAAAVLRQKALAASREQSAAAEAGTPAGAVIGARLLMTLLDLAEASSCTGLKQKPAATEPGCAAARTGSSANWSAVGSYSTQVKSVSVHCKYTSATAQTAETAAATALAVCTVAGVPSYEARLPSSAD
eukprot:21365-Heterococcus_DN1.PRE.5